MQLDPEYLRQHYASLADDALLEVDRADLVEMARTIFDLEVRVENWFRHKIPGTGNRICLMRRRTVNRTAREKNPAGSKKPLKYTVMGCSRERRMRRMLLWTVATR